MENNKQKQCPNLPPGHAAGAAVLNCYQSLRRQQPCTKTNQPVVLIIYPTRLAKLPGTSCSNLSSAKLFATRFPSILVRPFSSAVQSGNGQRRRLQLRDWQIVCVFVFGCLVQKFCSNCYALAGESPVFSRPRGSTGPINTGTALPCHATPVSDLWHGAKVSILWPFYDKLNQEAVGVRLRVRTVGVCSFGVGTKKKERWDHFHSSSVPTHADEQRCTVIHTIGIGVCPWPRPRVLTFGIC